MNRSIRAASCCVVFFASVDVVSAQAATQLHLGQAQSLTPFDLPAQALSESLHAVGKLTDINILVDLKMVGDLQAPAVKADLTADQAITRLLNGTGIKHRFIDAHTVVLSKDNGTEKAAAAADGSAANTRAADGNTASLVLSRSGEGENSQTSDDARNRFRLAQATQGGFAETTSVEGNEQTSQKRAVALEEVVVTAEKREERLSDTPIPVTVIDTEQLAERSQVLLRDYYASVPGLTLSPGTIGSQTLAIRGITTGRFTIPTVGVLIDDSSSMSAIQGPNQVPDIDPGDLARIEVLRGPQGTLYGANAMGGLLKFVTKDPSPDEYSGRIEAGTSSVFNGAQPGYNFRGSANIPLSPTAALRVSAFTRQDPGYVDDPAHNIVGLNEAEAYGGRLSFLWKPTSDFSAKLSALYQHYKAGGTSEVYQLPGLGDLQQTTVPGSGAYKREVELYSATLNYKHAGADFTSVTSYLINKSDTGTDYSAFYSDVAQQYFGVSGFETFAHYKLHKVSQELRVTLPLGSKFDWLLGGFFTHESVPGDITDQAANADTGQVVGVGDQYKAPGTYRELSAFTDLTFHLTDRLDLQVGGRESSFTRTASNTTTGPTTLAVYGGPPPLVNIYPDIKANSVTYLLTPSFKISPDVLLYARLASGFRPGGPNFPSPGVPTEFNSDKTRNYEIGLKGDFLNRTLSIDTSLYHIAWNNIQINLVTPDGLSYTSNGGDAKSDGVEVSVISRPLTGLTIGGWFDYDDAVLTQAFPASSTSYGHSGDPLPLSSRYSGNLSLDQRVSLSTRVTGFFGATASYVGDRTGVFTRTALRQAYPAYTKTDLRAGVECDSWTVNFYVNNVTDTRGELNGGRGYYLPYAFIYITPRTVGVSIAKSFK